MPRSAGSSAASSSVTPAQRLHAAGEQASRPSPTKGGRFRMHLGRLSRRAQAAPDAPLREPRLGREASALQLRLEAEVSPRPGARPELATPAASPASEGRGPGEEDPGGPDLRTHEETPAPGLPALSLAPELFAGPRGIALAPAVHARAAETQALADRLLRSLHVGRVRGRSEVRLRLGDHFEGLELRLQDAPDGVTLTVIADPGREVDAARVRARLGGALAGHGIRIDVA